MEKGQKSEDSIYIEMISDLDNDIKEHKENILDYLIVGSTVVIYGAIAALAFSANGYGNLDKIGYIGGGIEAFILSFATPEISKIIKLKKKKDRFKEIYASEDDLEEDNKKGRKI